jgi:acetyl esterase/lipase
MADASLQKLQLRLILSLPAPVLRAMSGGGVVYKGGRTLDPRLQFLAARSQGAPPMSSLTPEQARFGVTAMVQVMGGKVEPGVKVEPVTVPGAEDSLPARVYLPTGQDPETPVMVFAHFGGGVIGDLDTCEAFCSILARYWKGPVLSVAYRLAPEYRFPDGLEDMMAAYRWALAEAPRFGAPAGKAAVGGDSMGGNFAAIICQEMKRRGETEPVLQLLIYPALDVAGDSPSMTTYADAWPLTRETMEWFMANYMGPEDSPLDPRLSPVKASDVSGLAPAVIAAAGFDPLLDQGEIYARRLTEAGVPTRYKRYDALAHAFTAMTGVVAPADAACREIAQLARDTLTAQTAQSA